MHQRSASTPKRSKLLLSIAVYAAVLTMAMSRRATSRCQEISSSDGCANYIEVRVLRSYSHYTTIHIIIVLYQICDNFPTYCRTPGSDLVQVQVRLTLVIGHQKLVTELA